MHLSWRKRLEFMPDLRDMDQWPYVDHSCLPKVKRKKYLRNRRIAAEVLNGELFTSIAQKTNIDVSYISYLMNRCLAGEDDKPPALTKALIPGTRLNTSGRKKPLSETTNPLGTRGSFGMLLKIAPGLKENLDTMLLACVKRKKHGQNLTPKIFHAEVLRYLRDINWPSSSYPFDQEHLGYETCRKYFHRRITELNLSKEKPKRIILQKHRPMIAFQEVQIDAQIQDLSVSTEISFDDQTANIRLSRITLYLATDVATGCHLAYQLCLTKDPTKLDLQQLLANIHTPWEPLKLRTPELKYSPGACLPSALGDIFTHVGIGLVRLDNAMCHHAYMIRDYVCNTLGATLNHGLPAQPKGRNFVEYAFKLINEQTHRFASTTGSHSRDPIKESKANCKSPPVISLNAFKEILSVIITGHNLLPQERLGGKSPLQLIKEHVDFYPVQISYGQIYRRSNPFLFQELVPVSWAKHEGHLPHVHFQGHRYTGNCLSSLKAVGKKVILEFDSRDIREIKAITEDGEYLGVLKAPRTWQNFPFSTTTRKRIQKLTREKRLNTTDSLAGYFNYLLEHKNIPKISTELMRVNEEFNSPKLLLSKSNADEENINSGPPLSISKRSKVKTIPKWSPELVRRI